MSDHFEFDYYPLSYTRRVKSALAKTSSTLTLAPLSDSPRQELSETKSLDHKRFLYEPAMNTSPWVTATNTPTASPGQSFVSSQLSIDTPAIVQPNLTLSSAERQIFERKIEQLTQEIKFLNQKNAELEMNAIITFGAMSRISSTTSYSLPYDHVSTLLDGSGSMVNADTDQHALFIKPIATKKSFRLTRSFNLVPSMATAPETVAQLQEKIAKLEYVSRLWDRYMLNLVLLKKQNKDLMEELEEYRRKERKERKERNGQEEFH